jgi:uncharacterized DUF497 family protein
VTGGSSDPFLISVGVRHKMSTKHNVVVAEVEQCFYNFTGTEFQDDKRAQHKSDPPTQWFISETDTGRLLKVCFMHYVDKQKFKIKSAFEPNQEELDIFFGK